MNSSKRLLALAVAAACGAPLSAYATNGMNLEGYGPIATGMGGASMAYDNGTAAVMNNPATLGLMDEGSRLDIAVGVLGPDVTSKNSFGSESSSATSFMMPAIGYAKKSGQYTYGVGVFAQGGMGAEYKAGSEVDQTGAAGVSFAGGAPNADAHKQRSELGVGRLIFPLTFNVNEKLTVGGSVDYVWGGLDILWSMDARNFLGSMVNVDDGGTGKGAVLDGFVGGQASRAEASGSLVNTFVQNFDTSGDPFGAGANGAFWNFYWGNFSFNDNSDFSQQTRGDGIAGKLGFAYQVNDRLSIGGTYHAKTAMSDFSGNATMTFKVDLTSLAGGAPGASQAEIVVPAKVKVMNFQWPETYGLGMAYQASDKLMVAADWKRLNWSSVMKNFHMQLTANQGLTGLAGAFSGTVLDFVYPQNWKDQDVIELGASYAYTDALTLRAGYNAASNPVPNNYLSFLFPATIEQHYTIGFGYAFDKMSDINFSLTYAPKVTATESLTETNNLGTTPATTVSHSQTSWQMMYSHRF